jgi:cytochrome c biogenesis protein CcmG/thiol:disulfide interchange protein DsbE
VEREQQESASTRSGSAADPTAVLKAIPKVQLPERPTSRTPEDEIDQEQPAMSTSIAIRLATAGILGLGLALGTGPAHGQSGSDSNQSSPNQSSSKQSSSSSSSKSSSKQSSSSSSDSDRSSSSNSSSDSSSSRQSDSDSSSSRSSDSDRSSSRSGQSDSDRSSSRDSSRDRSSSSNSSSSRTRAAFDAPPRDWVDRLDRDDRTALEPLLGYVAPSWQGVDGVAWIGRGPQSLSDWRGRPVIVQSFTSRMNGVRIAERLARALEAAQVEDLAVLLVHIPEGAEHAPKVLERQPVPYPVLVDSTGRVADAFGFYKRPTNLLIDRQGNVRYAGLTADGAAAAAKVLAAESYDPEVPAAVRDQPEAVADDAAAFPTFTGSVGRARDLRGKAAPPFVVDRWMSDADAPNGRLLVIDFFATWCGPCIASVPHLRSLARAYPQDVCVVGLTDESRRNYDNGLRKRNMKTEDFGYAIASDPQARVKSAFAVTAIPHIAIVSGDGVVRWQGHPQRLDDATIRSLIEANRRSAGSAGPDSGSAPPRRWTRGS